MVFFCTNDALIMKSIKEFEAFYKSTLLPPLTELEERRLYMLKKRKDLIYIVVMVVSAHALLVYIEWIVWWTIFFPLAIAPYTAYKVYYSKYYDGDLSADFKKTVVGPIIKFSINPCMKYIPKDFVPYKDFERSELFLTKPDNYSGDDLIIGEMDDINLIMSELYVAYESKEPGLKEDQNWRTIFKGLFFVMNRDEAFGVNVMILPDTLQKRMGHIGQALQAHSRMRGKLVALPDLEFEENFAVYAPDIVEAKKILTPSLIEELNAFRRESGLDVYASFKGNKIYVAINYGDKDFFELDIQNSLLEFKYAASYYQDILFAMKLAKIMAPKKKKAA